MSRPRSLLQRVDDLPLRGLCKPFRQDIAGFSREDLKTRDYLRRVKSDSILAGQKLDVIGQFLSAVLTGTPSNHSRRDEKSNSRSIEKAGTKYGCDLSRNLDYAASWVLVKTAAQACRAMDTLCLPGTYVLPNGESFILLEAENNFSSPDPEKPGLRNMNVKMLVDIVRPDGTNGHHICETQIRPAQAFEWHARSESAYQEQRKWLRSMQILDANVDRFDPMTYAHLRLKYDRRAKAAGEFRITANAKAEASVPWIQEVDGYVPQPEKGYVQLDKGMSHPISLPGNVPLVA